MSSKRQQELLFNDVMKDIDELNNMSSRGSIDSKQDSKVSVVFSSGVHMKVQIEVTILVKNLMTKKEFPLNFCLQNSNYLNQLRLNPIQIFKEINNNYNLVMKKLKIILQNTLKVYCLSFKLSQFKFKNIVCFFVMLEVYAYNTSVVKMFF